MSPFAYGTGRHIPLVDCLGYRVTFRVPLLNTIHHCPTRSVEARKTARWYSSWILFSSFIPLVVMYSVWIPLSLMGKLDNIGAEDADISFDNEGPKESDWCNDSPYPEHEVAVYSVRRSPSICASSSSSPKSILKVRSYPAISSDRISKNKKKKAAPPRGESCLKIPNKSKIRFNLSMAENASEEDDTETARLLPPTNHTVHSIEAVAAVVTSEGDSSRLTPEG